MPPVPAVLYVIVFGGSLAYNPQVVSSGRFANHRTHARQWRRRVPETDTLTLPGSGNVTININLPGGVTSSITTAAPRSPRPAW